MSTTSIIAAVINKYRTLNPDNFPNGKRPEIYLDSAPSNDDGKAVFVPYVILRDEGLFPVYELEYSSRENNNIAVEVFYPTLGEVDQAVSAIKWNGGRPQQCLGFDFGTLPSLTPPRRLLAMRRVQERRNFAGYSRDGNRIHSATLTYQIVVQEDSK